MKKLAQPLSPTTPAKPIKPTWYFETPTLSEVQNTTCSNRLDHFPIPVLNRVKQNLWVESFAARHFQPINFQPVNWIYLTGCSLALLSIGLLVPSAPAHAADTQAGLDFDLPAAPTGSVPVPVSAPALGETATPSANSSPTSHLSNTISPLEIPSEAIAPPVGKANDSQALPPPPPSIPQADAAPRFVNVQSVGQLAEQLDRSVPAALEPSRQPNLSAQASHAEDINSANAPLEAIAPSLAVAPIAPVEAVSPPAPVSSAGTISGDGALNFDVEASSAARPLRPLAATIPPPLPADSPSAIPPSPPAVESPRTLPLDLQALFAGDENSLVAIAVGSAEGTRTPDGTKTPAYGGHVDPGNGVWNLGSFSYQHGAASPEAADQHQLKRLKTQAQQLHQTAQAHGIALSLQETLNGLDLANQSPAAALSNGGYIDRLVEARSMRLQGDEAIAWARTRSFLDPDTQRWNAPGLGNTVEGISRDQERRMGAIAQTLAQTITSSNNQSSRPIQADTAAPPIAPLKSPASLVDQLLSLDLPPTH